MDRYWMEFTKSGSVNDYLFYKRKENAKKEEQLLKAYIASGKEAASGGTAAGSYGNGDIFST